MKLLILLSILTGWLFAEVREFFANGGIGNLLAFGLLRILIVISSMVLTILFVMFPRMIYEAYWLFNENFQNALKRKEDNLGKIEKKGKK